MSKNLVLALVCVLLGSVAEAQTFVQFKLDPTAQPFNDAVGTIDADQNFAVGNAVCVGANYETFPQLTILSVVDNGSGGSNTYTLIQAATGGITVFAAAYCSVIERVADIVTITLSANTTAQARLFLAEFTGNASAGAFGGRAGFGEAGGTTHTSGTVAVQGATSTLWGFTYGEGGSTYTFDATFTLNAGGDNTRFVSGQKSVAGVNTALNTTSAIGRAAASILIEILPAVGPARLRAVGL